MKKLNMRLDVVTANLHVVSKHQIDAVQSIVRRVREGLGRYPDVIGCQEAIQLQDAKTIGRYRVVKTIRPKVHDNTNVILLKRWFLIESSTWHFGAPAFGDGLNHNPRHYHVLRYRKWGRKAAHIDTHLSVIAEPHGRVITPQHLPSGLLRSHADMVLGIVDLADQLRRDGYLVTLTADSNDNTGWQYALRTVLEQRGYLVVRNGIDLVAAHKSQVKSRHQHRPVVVPKALTRSDHEALAVALDV